MKRLSRQDIEAAFRALAEKLRVQNAHVELLLVGGAAMVLRYRARDSTKDVDAIVLKSDAPRHVAEIAGEIAGELGLPPDWLNEGAKGYLHGLDLGEAIFEHRHLVIRSASTAQLFAMKLSAWRDDLDIEDARLLLRSLQGGRQSIWSAVERHIIPGRELKARYAFDDLWESDHEPQ